MQLSVDSEDCDQYPFPDAGVLTAVFESEIESLWPQGAPKPEIVEISISSLSSSDMRKQNVTFANIDSTTDVLSFPMWESNGQFVPETDCPLLLLGDVLLCPEKISENAAENGKEYIDELSLVLAHSLLHLLGFDHETEENEADMWKRQERIKNKIMGELLK
ncbi:MAG: rRNA maturation RNase YbeY [Synergistaceae bacterium]|nr:rRNA maturation RNase YbeY [Synergistaceae bacterium]